ncbi:ribonuclease HII [Candidatus Babeliales bacterium]|nr:ribonuclease HII [Candidatus Babeliales bacterium]
MSHQQSAKKKHLFPKQFFEKDAWANGLRVCGIDEAGRGPLAGAVVVAAVVLPPNTTYKLLKDSKIMTEEEREQAYAWIVKNCLFSIAQADHHAIDAINIYQATLRAMRKAYVQLINMMGSQFETLRYVVVDAMPVFMNEPYKHANLDFHNFTFGESYSRSIAAASIVAKVTRDRLMATTQKLFPAYAFDQHKGYATAEHIVSIKEHGPSIVHRTSYLSNIIKSKQDHEHQSPLF